MNATEVDGGVVDFATDWHVFGRRLYFLIFPKLSGVLKLWLALAETWLSCSCSHVWNSEAQMTDMLNSTAAALLQMDESWVRVKLSS